MGVLEPLWAWLAAAASPYALAVNGPYVLAFLAVAGEVAWRAWRLPSRRRSLLTSAATAGGMAAGALVVGAAYTVALRWLWERVALVRWEAAATLLDAHPIAAAVATFVAWDLSGWAYHQVGHRTAIGWAAHQAHHTGTDYDLTLGLRQTWLPFHGLLHHPLLALAGFELRVVFVCAALSSCWQVLEHTAAPIRFPRWVEAIVMTPAAHRHHHGRDGGLVNVGPFLTVWDRLTGTWVPPDVPAPVAYGPVEPSSANPLRLELAGWIQLLGHRRRRVAWAPAAEQAG